MAKLAPTSIKYIIRAHIKTKGVVEKPDVIGAIFGQTEGLLGSELDLRELQRTGRIGRVEVNIKSMQGNSEGEIIIPSSLDAAETSLLAATLETIERIGPCTAEIKLVAVEDTRTAKRQYAVEKAREILKGLQESSGPETSEISEQIKESVRSDEITTYKGMPCGPALLESDEIIIVEGRADIVLLLKYGIRNAIAIEGTSIPKDIGELTKEKTTTVFVDGDRGGSLIVKELLQVADADFVARAPEGKEVEELTKKEVYKSLRERISVDQYKRQESVDYSNKRPQFEHRFRREESQFRRELPPPRRSLFGRIKEKREEASRIKPGQKQFFKDTLDNLVGTRAAYIFGPNNEILGKVPVIELTNTLKMMENPYAVVLDGMVDMRLNMVARMKGVKFVVGTEKENIVSPVVILARRDLE